jgi:organic radical activating enzyme
LNRILDEVGRPINLSISGGEPTLSPHLPELVDMFYHRGHTITITSNGVRTADWWRRIAPKMSSISFSYHPSYHKDNFIENCTAAAEHTYATVRVMMDSRYFDQAVDMYRQLIEHPTLALEAVRIVPETSRRMTGAEYTERQLAWINKFSMPIYKNRYLAAVKPTHMGASYFWSDGTVDKRGRSNHLIATRQNDFRGWDCNMGIESLFFGWDGWVKGANCMQNSKLFHINDHAGHELPYRAEICTQPQCDCGTDVNLSKVPLNIDTSLLDVKPKPVLSEQEYQIKFFSKSDK